MFQDAMTLKYHTVPSVWHISTYLVHKGMANSCTCTDVGLQYVSQLLYGFMVLKNTNFLRE